jgi:cytochrome P450
LRELARGPIAVIRRRFKTYGDVFFVSNRGVPMYVMRHPDHLHEVLVTKASSFVKRSKDLDLFLGNGLLTSNGELWRRQRRLIQPAFQRPRIAQYAEIMVEHTQRMLQQWKPGEVREIGRDMMELTLSVVCKALLDHDTHGQTDAVAHAMTVLQDTTGAFDLFPSWMPTPLHRRKKNAVRELDEIIYPMIDARTNESGSDLISQLKFERDEQGTMSRRQLRDELVTLFLAGHETTALAMGWTFFMLAQNPLEEQKLFEEVDRVLAGRPPTFQDLEALTHTRNVVQETMRLYPPLYILPRVANTDVQVAGYEIAQGSEIVLWVYFCQRDQRWFPAPDTFLPDRFLPDSGGILHPHAYLPFGAGSRACIGRHFALAEEQLILASVAQTYRLVLEPGQNITLNPRVTLGPSSPIRMRVEPRRPGASP